MATANQRTCDETPQGKSRVGAWHCWTFPYVGLKACECRCQAVPQDPSMPLLRTHSRCACGIRGTLCSCLKLPFGNHAFQSPMKGRVGLCPLRDPVIELCLHVTTDTPTERPGWATPPAPFFCAPGKGDTCCEAQDGSDRRISRSGLTGGARITPDAYTALRWGGTELPLDSLGASFGLLSVLQLPSPCDHKDQRAVLLRKRQWLRLGSLRTAIRDKGWSQNSLRNYPKKPV